MEHLPLISVIVPVYKVEKFFNHCIESIVDQTHNNLEIILVDDGSPDNCPVICDAWAAKDSRIKVIHQYNAGAGAARNAALDIAKGEFISLIDSDDYIEIHMYEHMLSLMAEDIDIVECGILETNSDNAVLDDGGSYEFTVYSVQEALELHIKDRIFRQTPPNKLYRHNVVKGIKFPVGKQIDDEFWTYRVIANANKLVRTSCNMYAYRQQPDSIMHKKFALSRLQAVEAKCQRLELIKDKFPSLISMCVINLWYTCLYMGQMSLLHMREEDQYEAFSILQDAIARNHLTKYEISSLPLKQRIWAHLTNISFKNTCKLRNCLRVGI